MIKLALSLVIIASATLTGNSFSMRLTARRRTLASVVASLSRMKTLICFGSFDTLRIIEECFCDEDFPLLRSSAFSSELTFDSAFSKSVEEIPSSFALKKADKDLLLAFLSQLGTTDVTGQVAHVELYTQLFKERLEQVRQQEADKSKLYRVLGFSCGSAISLLIA